MPKKDIFEKNSSLTILLSSLLVTCVEDLACKSSHNNFYHKNEQFNLYIFNVFTCDIYLVLYMEHYLQPASPCVLKFLSFRYLTLFGETCGSMFKG